MCYIVEIFMFQLETPFVCYIVETFMFQLETPLVCSIVETFMFPLETLFFILLRHLCFHWRHLFVLRC